MTASNPTKIKLSQWDALLVESLRALGCSDDELIRRVRSGETPTDESDFRFEYGDLTAFANREPETFEAAVKMGYQIKYNTIGGIRSWIFVVLGQEPEVVRDPGNESVTARLSPTERDRLASVLSYGWTISPAAGESDRYRIEPARA
ncbi:hypothetical protein [Cohnella nanjingensis]|uniref:Uncharacterized protein n=1 Tax=Cohnella nanjingensis TaxID=1387779 RepID=A0A7X0RRA8_9BACL|nr:hypothetical protein [Cohnella nanjingensis]MBB6672096.1 hypothetical protein [Cohnella nanjingensis]